MPITPFHFGPGFFIKSLNVKKFSFRAFVLANIFIDVEPLYYMLTHQYPLHRFFHTYIGATLMAGLTILFVRIVWKKLSPVAVVVGALVGTCSHILLDSLMHADIKPFSPFADNNMLLHKLSYLHLHMFCLGAGIMGGLIYFWKRNLMMQKEKESL